MGKGGWGVDDRGRGQAVILLNLKFLLTQSRLGCSRGHTRVHNRSQKGHGAHHRVPRLAERYRLVSKWAQGRGAVLHVRVFDGQPQEVQDAFVLRAAANVLGHLIPVVLVHFQALDGGRDAPGATVFTHVRTEQLSIILSFAPQVAAAFLARSSLSRSSRRSCSVQTTAALSGGTTSITADSSARRTLSGVPLRNRPSCCTCQSSGQSFADPLIYPSLFPGKTSLAGWPGPAGTRDRIQNLRGPPPPPPGAFRKTGICASAFVDLGRLRLQGHQTGGSVCQHVKV